MKRLKCNIVLLFFLILCNGQLSGQNRGILGFERESSKGRLLPLPVLYYTPETSWAFGITGQYLFHFADDTTGPISVVGLTGIYTLNQQLIIHPNWDLVLKKNRQRVSGDILYEKFPLDFYGIGNDTKLSDAEKVTTRWLLVKNRWLWRIRPGLFVGPQYRLEYAFDVDYPEDGLLDSISAEGKDGYVASGAGLAVVYDTREHNLFPFTGWYIIFSNHFYPEWLGSRHYFSNFKLDARRYLNPFGSHVIALQGLVNVNTHEPPFRMLALLGGDQLMRGFYEGRYREKLLAAGQVEWRFPIWWRFIGAAFAGVGDVANMPHDFQLEELKYSVGAGLRFTLDAKERINFRLDYALGLGKEEGARQGQFYLRISEAF